MNATQTYSVVHRWTLELAEKYGLRPFALRVLLAVADAGGSRSTLELERDLLAEGAAIRRSLPDLRRVGLVVDRAATGGPPKPGVRSVLHLTELGGLLADEVQEALAA